MYRVGFPGWKLAASLGVTLVFRVDVLQDPEAGVYLATSPDIPGLVAEAPSIEELFKEVHHGADMLLQDQLRIKDQGKQTAVRAAWSDVALAA